MHVITDAQSEAYHVVFGIREDDLTLRTTGLRNFELRKSPKFAGTVFLLLCGEKVLELEEQGRILIELFSDHIGNRIETDFAIGRRDTQDVADALLELKVAVTQLIEDGGCELADCCGHRLTSCLVLHQVVQRSNVLGGQLAQDLLSTHALLLQQPVVMVLTGAFASSRLLLLCSLSSTATLAFG